MQEARPGIETPHYAWRRGIADVDDLETRVGAAAVHYEVRVVTFNPHVVDTRRQFGVVESGNLRRMKRIRQVQKRDSVSPIIRGLVGDDRERTVGPIQVFLLE